MHTSILRVFLIIATVFVAVLAGTRLYGAYRWNADTQALRERLDAAPLENMRAEARGQMVGGQVVGTTWLGRFWNYEERGSMRVPLDGEVAWLLPEGARPYWRGHTTEIVYEFAR